jgi:hypothetical protein
LGIAKGQGEDNASFIFPQDLDGGGGKDAAPRMMRKMITKKIAAEIPAIRAIRLSPFQTVRKI